MFSMWMAELSRRSGVPVATIKYYLREGLLPAGEATGATRARYDESHLDRLRLVRALVEVGQMSIARVREVLEATTSGTTLHRTLGVTQDALASTAEPRPEAMDRVDALVARLGWDVRPDAGTRRDLALALDALASAGDPVGDDVLGWYASLLEPLAQQEVASVDPSDEVRAVRQIVVRTVLLEPVIRSLRRMAHEHASAARFDG